MEWRTKERKRKGKKREMVTEGSVRRKGKNDEER